MASPQPPSPPRKVISPPRKVIEPFQYPAPKLVMTPPSLSPLHMTPPNLELPNFSPIQDHMPLPTISASTFIPPQSFLTHRHPQPVSVARFARFDPTLLAVGCSAEEPDAPGPVGGEGSVTIFRVEDVEREVRGDAEIVARGVYDVRQKIRPRLHEMSTLKTSAAVLDLEFSPYEPELLVATLATGEIVLYRVRRGRYTPTRLSSHVLAKNAPVHQLTFSPSIRGLAVAAAGDGMVYFVRIAGFPREDNTVKAVRTLRASDAAVLRATFSADGKSLFTGAADGALAEWRVEDLDNIQPAWREDTCSRGITTVVPWPSPFASDVGLKRRLLLAGTRDGAMRVLDLSSHVRPPYCRQELELQGTVWRLAPLPPLPDGREVEMVGAGSFCAAVHPEVALDPELQGMLAAAGEGGGRVLIHKPKFEEVFLPRRDGSDIVDWTTSEGVLMDHEGREKQYYWYDLADIEEHRDSRVMAADATAVIDYDPLFKDAGKQRLRRGWRLVTASRDGTMCFWQVYVE